MQSSTAELALRMRWQPTVALLLSRTRTIPPQIPSSIQWPTRFPKRHSRSRRTRDVAVEARQRRAVGRTHVAHWSKYPSARIVLGALRDGARWFHPTSRTIRCSARAPSATHRQTCARRQPRLHAISAPYPAHRPHRPRRNPSSSVCRCQRAPKARCAVCTQPGAAAEDPRPTAGNPAVNPWPTSGSTRSAHRSLPVRAT